MDNTQARPLLARRAAAADAPALARLREVMLSDMGMVAAGTDPGWRHEAEAWFAQHPDLGVVSCAAGMCDHHAPGPGNPGGVQGLVFNMSTDPRCRRRGYARACLDDPNAADYRVHKYCRRIVTCPWSRFHVFGVLSYRAYQAFLAGIWSCAVWLEGEF